MTTKKLIEVALPLEAINTASAREKSIRHGHPSTLHLWWARRPLATTRAVIWASLVDDPSSHPELYPTEDDQNRERERLFRILEKLVVWKKKKNETVVNLAISEIMKSTDNNPPALLDPFFFFCSIPLEAQRLGLEAYAHDLNPVAIMINKAMIEIPSRFANMAPINPDSIKMGDTGWIGTSGIVEDFRYYAGILKKEAFKRIGHHYPKITIPQSQGGGEATVIAWIWARTVMCPNPVCGCRMPLANSFILSKKIGNEASIHASIDQNTGLPIYKINRNANQTITPKVGKGRFRCVFCGHIADKDYIHEEFKCHRDSSELLAVVAEARQGRLYIDADAVQRDAAVVERPKDYPDQEMNDKCTDLVSGRGYGFSKWSQLFTNRQLLLLTTLSEIIIEIQELIEKDAVLAGLKNDHISFEDNGLGAKAYGQAIGLYLSFLVDKLADYNSSFCSWNPPREGIRNTFGRQAIPMVWDFAEANPFSNSTGCINNMIDWITKSLQLLPTNTKEGHVTQCDAQSDSGLRGVMVSTDPPYYDNIGYADLSDFFYIWLRWSMRNSFPSIFRTMLVPKAEELVAMPYRHGGNPELAKSFFEDGMSKTFRQLYLCSREDIPVTVYYAYKQNESDEGSSGWETILSAIIQAGFAITGTWPMSTERTARNIGIGSNALTSSIVLVCRKRSANVPQITRRNLISILRRELRPALKKLQESNIPPVDLAQSAIGPGMGVFSRYRKVLEADGTSMSVRSALHVINEEIDLYFNEQVGDLDAMSRFCIELYTQNAFNDIKFGDADILARAKGTSVAALSSHGIVYAKAGTVHLIERTELPEKIDENENCIWLLTQQLTQDMATGGVEACAKAVFLMFGSNAERAKDLAYRLYTIAEQKKWATEAYAYNALVVAWPDIQSRAAMMQREKPEQMDMFSMGLLDT